MLDIETEDYMLAYAQRMAKEFRPDGNVHEKEWVAKYLGVSTLVKNTAFDYAFRIMNQSEDDVPKRFAFLGNTVADAVLEKNLGEEVGAQEIRSLMEVKDGWVIAGHCDKICAGSGRVWTVEAKYHLEVSTDKVELAKRQGLLCLGLAWKSHLSGDSVFGNADYVEHSEEFTWPEGYEPCGTVTMMAPSHTHDELVQFHPASPRELIELVDFYEAKARAIIDAVLNEDLSLALAWDRSEAGAQEFGRAIEDIGTIDDQAFASAANNYTNVSEQIKALEDKKKELRSILESKLRENGTKSGEAGGFRVSVIDYNGSEVSYTKKPYSAIRVKRLTD